MATSAGSELHAHHRALKLDARFFKVFLGAGPTAQLFFHMFASEPSARGVNLFGPFGYLGEYGNATLIHFYKTARDVQLKVRAVF